ncbi:hypothetical protein KC332_g1438 [Hortaea werneckii]|uniref:ASST-domain-containing protein n=2 Tax=Hortaea werneckii TaxID=91943 RepID=A0A3M7IEA2_HORWE|nr:hypothetical protein KC350_g4996 [Hortaea werneckii]OTA24873.1 hypothetical protein BTJ68_11995 [Hortaea werneckii EXF-2000]KAI6846846.1 hypothetical protein KC358_g2630 [Hortaea werneckii]KAI6939985.1 hypothetical protein KC348_g5130 [Hortaea werneckii]KAI6941327.1 hypothetical protein KC341_g2954 [Hortaea werneckii]
MQTLLLFLCYLAPCLASSQGLGGSHDAIPRPYDKSLDIGVRGSYPVKKGISSKLAAPETNILRWSPECDDGRYHFVTPRGWKVPRPGPMILDAKGSMIWSQHFDNEFGGQAYDLKVQRFKGEDHLTFWLGDDRIRGHGAGEYYMLNSSYDVVRRIKAGNGMAADLHELIITPEGNALMIIFQPFPFDVRPVGRKLNDVWNHAIWDCLIQEISIDSGEVLFQWRGSEHISINNTYNVLDDISVGIRNNPFDPFHFNSVQKDDDGNYLISVRNPHAIFYIDKNSGEIIWTLGGKHNDFMDLSGGHALNFAWQHDARFVSPSAFPSIYAPPRSQSGISTRLMTLFDNAAMDWNYEYGQPYSRGLLLELTFLTKPSKPISKRTLQPDSPRPEPLRPLEGRALSGMSKQDADKIAAINGTNPAYTVRVIQTFENPSHVRSGTQGSVQTLASQDPATDARVLLGYGLNPVLTEFASNGTVLCDIRFGAASAWETGDVQSYRAYKSHWVGKPRDSPRAAIKAGKVYVSWNGATEVRSWLVQAADTVDGDEKAWRDILQPASRTDFETAIALPKDYRKIKCLRAIALDEKGEVCGNGVSNVLRPGFTAALLDQHRQHSTPVLILGFAIGLFVLYKVVGCLFAWRNGRKNARYQKISQA